MKYILSHDHDSADTSWDTHADNFRGLRDRLIPQVDRPVANLLQDLQDRGLLDDILVVRMAGAGVSGGQVHGATDRIGSEPVSDPVAPADLSATIFHLLGLDSSAKIPDALGRKFPISEGRVLRDVLG